jgi:hypothetical protein
MNAKSVRSDFIYPPAYCPTCGIFEAIGTIAIRPGVKVNLQGSGVTNCPHCGGDARFVNGTYEAYSDRLHLILDANIPVEARRALVALVEKVRDDAIDLKQARTEAEKISPKAARLFDIADWPAEAKAALYAGILVAAATLAAPRLSPAPERPPVIINQTFSPPGPRKELRQRFTSTTALTPIPRLPTPNPHRKRPGSP